MKATKLGSIKDNFPFKRTKYSKTTYTKEQNLNKPPRSAFTSNQSGRTYTMAKKTLVYALSLFIIFCGFGCKKESKAEKITVEQLKAKYGIDLIAAWENSTVIVNMRSVANPNKGVKPQKDDIVTLEEGDFTWDGSNFITCDNVKFSGVNNQTTIVSMCNWLFYENTPAQNLTCTDTNQHGQIMAWYTNWSNSVWRSNLVTQ